MSKESGHTFDVPEPNHVDLDTHGDDALDIQREITVNEPPAPEEVNTPDYSPSKTAMEEAFAKAEEQKTEREQRAEEESEATTDELKQLYADNPELTLPLEKEEESAIELDINEKLDQARANAEADQNTKENEVLTDTDYENKTIEAIGEISERIQIAKDEGRDNDAVFLEEQKYNLAKKVVSLSPFQQPELEGYIEQYEKWNPKSEDSKIEETDEPPKVFLKEEDRQQTENDAEGEALQEDHDATTEEILQEADAHDKYRESIEDTPQVLPSDSIREHPDEDALELQELLGHEPSNVVLQVKAEKLAKERAEVAAKEVDPLPATETQVPEEESVESVESVEAIDDKAITVRKFEQFGVSIDDMNASVEGFKDLNDGQKLLVAENFEQLALGHLDKEQAAKFEALQAETQSKGITGNEGAISGRLKAARNGAQMVWQSFRRTHHLNELGKEAFEEQLQNGLSTHQDVLETLTISAANGPGIEYKNGVAEIQYASGFQNLDAEQQSSVDAFNSIANEFTRIPLEWQHAKEGSEERQKYDAARTSFEAAKDKVLAIKESEVGPENEAQLLMFCARMKHGVEMNQLFNSYPDVEERLATIKDGETWAAAMQHQLKEKGILMATGFVTRHALTGIMSVAAIPAAVVSGGVVGTIRGRIQGAKDIDERDFLARHGETKDGVAEANLNSSENMANKLEDIIKLAQNAPTEEERRNYIARGIRRANVAAQKMKDGSLDFGNGAESVTNMSRLMDSLGEIHALDMMTETSKNESNQDDRFNQLYSKIQETSAEALSELDREHIKQAMWEGAKSGLKFGAIGAIITDVFRGGAAAATVYENTLDNAETVKETLAKPAIEGTGTTEEITKEYEAQGINPETGESVISEEEKKAFEGVLDEKEAEAAFPPLEVKKGDTVWGLIKSELGEGATDTEIANRINALSKLSQEDLYDRGFRANKTGVIDINHIEPGQNLDLNHMRSNETQVEVPAPVVQQAVAPEIPEVSEVENIPLDQIPEVSEVITIPADQIPEVGEISEVPEQEQGPQNKSFQELYESHNSVVDFASREEWINQLTSYYEENNMYPLHDPHELAVGQERTLRYAKLMEEVTDRTYDPHNDKIELVSTQEKQVLLVNDREYPITEKQFLEQISIESGAEKAAELKAYFEDTRTQAESPIEEVAAIEEERVVDISTKAAELSGRRMTPEEYKAYADLYGARIDKEIGERIYKDHNEHGGVRRRLISGHGPLNDILDRVVRNGINTATGANVENNMTAWQYDKTIPVEDMLRNNNIALQESQGPFRKVDNFDYQNRTQLHQTLSIMSRDMKPFPGETIGEYLVRHEAFEQDAMNTFRDEQVA